MARVNIGPKPYISPMPVLVLASYNQQNNPSAMLVAWGSISGMKEIALYVDPQRYTLKGILDKKAFTVSMAEKEYFEACDYLGIVSGNKVKDKFDVSGFTASKSDFVNAPLINELKFTLECSLKSYNEDNWLLVGEIVNVSLDESILGEDSKVSYDKYNPLAFDWMNLAYLSLGEKVGNAFRDGKKLKDR